MYQMILTILVLNNNIIASKTTVIPETYKTVEMCKQAAVVAQEYVNKVAKESNTVPGRVTCVHQALI